MASQQKQTPQRDTSEQIRDDDPKSKPLIIYKSVTEYEKKIAQLNQDNFDLRLYCYNLEEKVKKMGAQTGSEESRDRLRMAQSNVSNLEQEVRSLKENIERKAELLLEGSAALDKLRCELEKTQQAKQQLCCVIHHRDCQIEQLAKDNETLCLAASQMEQQIFCMNQRLLATEARLRELDELVRRRNFELADARDRLRECCECLQEMVNTEDQRFAVASEPFQAELKKLQTELDRLRAENADLQARQKQLLQLQQDVDLLEREDGELRAELQAERYNLANQRQQYDKQLAELQSQICNMQKVPSVQSDSQPQPACSPCDDSGQGSQSPTLASEAALSNEYATELAHLKNKCELRVEKMKKLNRSGTASSLNLRTQLKDLKNWMHCTLTPQFQSIVRDAENAEVDIDEKLLDTMEDIVNLCADELNGLIDGAQRVSCSLKRCESDGLTDLIADAKENHANLRSLVLKAGRKGYKVCYNQAETSTEEKINKQDEDTLSLTSTVHTETPKCGKAQQYVEKMASDPSIDEQITTLTDLKQSFAEQRQSLESDSNVTCERIGKLIEELNVSTRRVQTVLAKNVDSDCARPRDQKKAGLDELVELSRQIRDEFSEQIRLLEEKAENCRHCKIKQQERQKSPVCQVGRFNDDAAAAGVPIDSMKSIEAIISELEVSTREILSLLEEMQSATETNRREELWRKFIDQYAQQENRLSRQLRELEPSLVERQATGFKLNSALQARAEKLAKRMNEINGRYNTLEQGPYRAAKEEFACSSSVGLQLIAAQNLDTFKRFFVHETSRSPQEIAFFAEITRLINSVNAAIKQANSIFSEQNAERFDVNKGAASINNLIDKYAELQNFLRRKLMLLRQAEAQSEKETIKRRQDLLLLVFENLLFEFEQFCSIGRQAIQTIPYNGKRQSILAKISWLIEDAHANNQMFEALFIMGHDCAKVCHLLSLTARQEDQATQPDQTIVQSSLLDSSESFCQRLVVNDNKLRPTIQPCPQPVTCARKELLSSVVSETAEPSNAVPASGTLDSFTSECEIREWLHQDQICNRPVGAAAAKDEYGCLPALYAQRVDHICRDRQPRNACMYRSRSEPRTECQPGKSKDSQPNKQTMKRNLSYSDIQCRRTTCSGKRVLKSPETVQSLPKIEFDVIVDTESTEGCQRGYSSTPSEMESEMSFRRQSESSTVPKCDQKITASIHVGSKQRPSAWTLSKESNERQQQSRPEHCNLESASPGWRRPNYSSSRATDGGTAKTFGTTVSALEDASQSVMQLKCTRLPAEDYKQQQSGKQSQQSIQGNYPAVVYLSCVENTRSDTSKISNDAMLLCQPRSAADNANDSFSDPCSQQSLTIKSELKALLKNLGTLRGNCRSGGSHEFSGRDISSLMSQIKHVLGDCSLDQSSGYECATLHTEAHSSINPKADSGNNRTSMKYLPQKPETNAIHINYPITWSEIKSDKELRCAQFCFSNTNWSGATLHLAQIEQVSSDNNNMRHLTEPDEQVGHATCRQDETDSVFMQVSIVQPQQLHSARYDTEEQLQSLISMWSPENLGSIDANLQRAVWLLKTINIESAELLKPLLVQDDSHFNVGKVLETVKLISNRLAYLLSSLEQIGESLPHMALDYRGKLITECEDLLWDLLNFHSESFETAKTKLRSCQEQRGIVNCAELDTALKAGERILSKLRTFLTGSSSTDERWAQCRTVPSVQLEIILRELATQLETISDGIEQVNLSKCNPSTNPLFMDKISGLVNQFERFHEFLHSWLAKFSTLPLPGGAFQSGPQRVFLLGLLNTITCQRKELETLFDGDVIQSLFKDNCERQKLLRRLSTIIMDSKGCVHAFEAMTLEKTDGPTLKRLDSDASSSSPCIPDDKSGNVSFNKLSEARNSERDAPRVEDDTHAASAPLRSECWSNLATAATANGVNSSAIRTPIGSVECFASPLHSVHCDPGKEVPRRRHSMPQSIETKPELQAIITRLSSLQNACKSNVQADSTDDRGSLLAEAECLAVSDASNSSWQDKPASTPAAMADSQSSYGKERCRRLGTIRAHKIDKLLCAIKAIVRTAQPTKTTLKSTPRSRSISSKEALKQLKKQPAKLGSRKRSSRKLARKIAALLKNYSKALASRSPKLDGSRSITLTTDSSDLSALISNVRSLLHTRGAGCNSSSSCNTVSFVRRPRQKNQSNARHFATLVDISCDQGDQIEQASEADEQQRMDITVSNATVYDACPTESATDAGCSCCDSLATWEALSIPTSLNQLADWESGSELACPSESQRRQLMDSHSLSQIASSALGTETEIVGSRSATVNPTTADLWSQNEALSIFDGYSVKLKNSFDDLELDIAASGVWPTYSLSGSIEQEKSWLTGQTPDDRKSVLTIN